eukprot:gnl/TRDRNA2_/TRDRNA2_157071_c0_seq2.p1 gnl/TRDRNA2_/TRDRNA2_157071_c0~~gnl/TRDRNA2_/TRDRNA2_157071_c0_seq2.p1  ORF type:complete len:361 (+),score=48.14 gnl/TRDRNA2_/TRDRNA2_157071_c0_seq2:87-1169(+)
MPAINDRSVIRTIHSRTTHPGNNSQCGFLFDVTAKAHVSVSTVSFVPGTQDCDYDIWTARDTHERVHQTQKAWALVAKGTHTGPKGAKHCVHLQPHVTIPRGERYAFYISGQNVNAICFSTDSHNSNSAENDDLIIHLGHFKAFPWEGVLSTGPFGHNGMQEFVGALEYQVLQSRAADHVVLTSERLWEQRAFPDAELVAFGGQRFSVHRAVLAAASTTLEELLRAPSPAELVQPFGRQEAWSANVTEVGSVNCVLHVDAPAESVEALLRFMYTGYEGDTTDPGEMLRLAHLYELPALVKSSASRIAQTLTPANAVLSVRALRSYRDHPAVQPAWQMLLSNIQALMANDPLLLQEVLLSV